MAKQKGKTGEKLGKILIIIIIIVLGSSMLMAALYFATIGRSN